MRRVFLFLIFVLTYTNFNNLIAQIQTDTLVNRYSRFTEESSPEKLFLHTDKSHYVAGEYIWFKGYLINSSPLSVHEESRFIYAELYGDTLISRVKIKWTEEGFAGRIPVNHNTPTGNYTLRAYSRWMMNSTPDYMFNKQISVINPAFKEAEDSLSSDLNDHNAKAVASLQFFPESGRILAERFTQVAFKATDKHGRGADMSGVLYNSRDSVITEISAEHNGMGMFRFYPLTDERYHVIIKNQNGEKERFNLPAPEHSGASVNVLNRDGRIFITASVTNDLLSAGAIFIAHNGDEIYLSEELSREDRVFVLKEEDLLPGINHIVIADRQMNTLAERLFFIFPDNVPTISLEADKPSEELGRREKRTIRLSIKDRTDKPVKGEFSVSVTDSYLAPAEPFAENLISYMNLTSELKGPVENAGWYFDEASSGRKRAMDLLMMVQGWRYYDLPLILGERKIATGKKAASKPFFLKEYTQTISGRATSNFRNTKRAILSVLAPEIDMAVSEPLNNTGHFIISELDFPDSTGFIISCTGKEGEKGYYLQVDKAIYPALSFYQYLPAAGFSKSRSSDDSYSKIFEATGGYGAIMLMAATVTSNVKVAAKYNPSPFNQTFERRQIRERADLDMYAGWSLFDYILGTFPGLMHGGTGEDGQRTIVSTRSSTIMGDKEEPHLYINRMRVSSTGDLDRYQVEDVENVAYLKGNEGFLYRTLSGVILVTLRHSVSSNAKSPFTYYNTLFERPLGWQKPSKFYSPDYSLAEDNRAVSFDTRSTLYWAPSIKTNENGEAEITYYSSDRITHHNISVEGVTINGEFFSLFR